MPTLILEEIMSNKARDLVCACLRMIVIKTFLNMLMFRQPSVVVAHVAFRAAALAYYFFANLFSNSFIIQFLVIVSCYLIYLIMSYNI